MRTGERGIRLFGAMMRVVFAGALVVAVATGSGCGGGDPALVAARVGGEAVSVGNVDHWARAISVGNVVASSLGPSRGTNRQRALEFLISSAWLTGEARRRGRAVSDKSVARRLRERTESFPNGQREFKEELSSTGQTVADVELEIRAELAATALREMVSASVPAVTQHEVADYYHRHIAQYRVPIKRRVDLIEGLPSRAAAVALGKRLGSGSRFAKQALHESVPRESAAEGERIGNRELVDGIFAAPIGRVGAPSHLGTGWVAMVVRGTIPPTVMPLTRVGSEIAKLLQDERRAQALASFTKTFRARWTALTRCRPGYVVQKCSEYHGVMKPEGNPLARG